MHFYVYDAATGDILRTGVASTAETAMMQAQKGELVALGVVDQMAHAVDVSAETHTVVARTRPHVRNRQLDAQIRIQTAEARQSRAVREALLALLPADHPARTRLQKAEDDIAALRADTQI